VRERLPGKARAKYFFLIFQSERRSDKITDDQDKNILRARTILFFIFYHGLTNQDDTHRDRSEIFFTRV